MGFWAKSTTLTFVRNTLVFQSNNLHAGNFTEILCMYMHYIHIFLRAKHTTILFIFQCHFYSKGIFDSAIIFMGIFPQSKTHTGSHLRELSIMCVIWSVWRCVRRAEWDRNIGSLMPLQRGLPAQVSLSYPSRPLFFPP